jgi:hypothetical protein
MVSNLKRPYQVKNLSVPQMQTLETEWSALKRGPLIAEPKKLKKLSGSGSGDEKISRSFYPLLPQRASGVP